MHEVSCTKEYNVTKKIILITAAVLFAAVLTGGIAAQTTEGPKDVVSVNGTIINSDEVKREMNMMYQRAVQSGVYPNSSEIDAYWQKAVETLIGREILFQDAVKNGFSADDTAVDNYISSLTQNYGGEEALSAALKEQGLSIDNLRNDTAKYYVISEYVTKVMMPLVSVSSDDVKKYYEENKQIFKKEETVAARHILLKLEEGATEQEDAEAKKRIEDIRARIVGGEDFAALAKEYSDCPSSEQGGSLGEFGRGRMVPPFDKVAFSLEPGVISEAVKTQFGWHIIEVTAKNSSETMSFEEVEPRLKEYMENLALEAKVNEHVGQIRADSEIIIF